VTALNRREFLKVSTAAAALPVAGCIARPIPVRSPYASAIPDADAGLVVNDVHSQLNATTVREIVKPRTVADVQAAVMRARSSGISVAVAGGRHAMGGQQFGEAGMLVDTRDLNRVLAFDAGRGTITVEGGIQWPQLLEHLNRVQEGAGRQWGIYQKQTGADRLSLGGALACNAHGRGLNLKPIVQQVEEFDLVDAAGELRTCSRAAHPDLFRLVIGGYGLFGIVTRVRLALRPRVKVRRVVMLAETPTVMDRLEERIRDGYQYGDYQFATDFTRDSFLRRGVFSCYQPVPDDTPLTGYDVLLAETDPDLVHFEVDLYWTWYAHRDPVQLLGAFGDRIRQFHVKDMRYVDHLPSWADVGTGVIDFARIFDAAGDPGRHEYIVERDDAGAGALSTAAAGYAYLRRIRF